MCYYTVLVCTRFPSEGDGLNAFPTGNPFWGITLLEVSILDIGSDFGALKKGSSIYLTPKRVLFGSPDRTTRRTKNELALYDRGT